MAVKIEIKGPIVTNTVGWLYHYIGWDACCPNDISKKLEEAGGEDVVLEINSGGGVCVAGFEMYNALMQYEGNVTANVIFAASAATFPACAADKTLIADAGIFMIHNTQSSASGDYRDMEMEADCLKEFNESIINVYVRKTGKSREELQALMDKDTYMSPQKAIEHGFVDDYIFGNPNPAEEGEENGKKTNAGTLQILQVMNAVSPVMSEEKAQEIIALLKLKEESVNNTASVGEPEGEEDKLQNNSGDTDSDIEPKENQNKEGDKKNMTVAEFLAEHPEAQAEMEKMLAAARNEGVTSENNRLQELDAISNSVSKEALHNAKYGEEKLDAKELAYQAMLDDGKKAKNYMKQAVADAEESGVNDVGASAENEEDADKADTMAAHVNRLRAMKGGK